MAIPLEYNVRSVFIRWPSTLVAVLGIAGTVAVFVVMLAMAQGFQAMLIGGGSRDNAIVLRGGADSEMMSAITLDQVRVIADAPGVARSASGDPLVSAEVVVVGAFPLLATGSDANVQIRGLSPIVLEVRPNARIVEGRFFQPGLTELVVGRNVSGTYAGFKLGSTVEFGGGRWTVVGVFDAGGSSYDSEVWCDAVVLNQVFKRPENIFQSATARLASPESFQAFKDAATSDPRLTVDVFRETAFYAEQSRMVSTIIRVLGFIVAIVMGVGAVFAALNTMYSAVASRSAEIATLKALGFSPASVVASFVAESTVIALAGGAVGVLASLPFNGFTTGTMNWSSFSYLAFAFRVTPEIVASGLVFSLLMGIVGGLPPALRAARLPIIVALREL
ncbi:MAG: ABC transporter permease [Candidatus Krumholzibacteria bacterium]|nr:ABC transporter permease [Candidatus Krumholzibacteria bacterium]